MSHHTANNTGKKLKSPGVILCLFLLLASAGFIAVLLHTKMLPGLYIAVLSTGILAVLCLIFWLTGDFHRRDRFVAGSVLALLCMALYIFTGYHVGLTQQALLQVTSPSAEKSVISFYVLDSDPAETLFAAAGYTFGILKTQDRANTDQTLRLVSQEQELTLKTREYDGLAQLADALSGDEIGAILLNQAYLALFDELPGYEDFPGQLRVLSTQNVEQPVEIQPVKPPSQEQVINVYISGSDTREDTLPGLSRSDVNILASINTTSREILLVSTPRDYYVPLSVSSGVPDKLTHAGIYGVQVSMDTLSMLYDVEIDYYFKVNFTGFVDIIDALGGIEVQSDYSFDAYGYHYDKGTNLLDGDAALGFCRERYSFSSGDRQRGKNQLAVIKGIIQKAVSPSILSTYTSILEHVQACIDTNVPYDLIASLVRRQLSDGASWTVNSYSVDGTGDTQVPYSMSSPVYVMVPDMTTVEHAKELLKKTAREPAPDET